MNGPDDLVDLPAVIEHACVAVCKREGQRYTRAVANELSSAIDACRDDRRKSDLTGLLCAVEKLVDPELPMDRSGGT